MTFNENNSSQEYLKVLGDDVLKKILSENEEKLRKGTLDEKINKTITSIKLILALRESTNKEKLSNTIHDHVLRYQELNKDWERLDSTGRKDEQEIISNEMGIISSFLYELGLDTDGNVLKTALKVQETKNNIIQLGLNL